jgi:hypothetical protein
MIALAFPASHPRLGLPSRRLGLWLAAIAVTAVLSFAWALRDWTALSLLRLPDNDDIARLAQVRDFLNGQAFNDLSQHRLGPAPGASMHWSRLVDLPIAALIVLFTPLLGSHGAEVAAVIAWPALLFLAYLLLAVRIAGRLGGAGAQVPALLLAGLAFPTISLFVPGRIDHHGLQIVLTLVLADTLVARPSLKQGLIGGASVASGLAIGLEAAPEIIAAMLAMGLAWLWGDQADDRRALGFGAALGGITLALLAFARPQVWPEQWCDGFTPASTRATLVLAGAWLLLGLGGMRARGWHRPALAALLGGGAAALAWRTSSVCIAGPYGALDPFLQQVWMRNVGEARSLFVGQDTFGTSIAYGGLVLAGAVAALFRLAEPRWRTFALFLVLGAGAAVLQIRVTYIMAGLAILPFAVLLGRGDGTLARRLACWALGAGVLYNLAGSQFDAAFARPAIAAKQVQKDCTAPGNFAEIAKLPPGLVMAPLDLDSYLLGLTPHRVEAALYHRNNAGNLAMYRFFLSPPAAAEKQARAAGVSYVALCPDQLQENGLAPYRPGSLVEQLQGGGAPPAWLERIPTTSPIQLYRVR